MTIDSNNQSLIKDFSALDSGKSLELYLKEEAWQDDLEGETRVYLIKDDQNNIVLYFSIKCGLLYADDKYDGLEQVEKEYVDLFIQHMKEKNTEELNNIYTACIFDLESDEATKLYELAQNRFDRKDISNSLGETDTTLNVADCYSAIEIKHFCRNAAYEAIKGIEVPIGFAVFWEKIAEKIIEINEMIGCKYLYLFAADNTESEKNRRLVSHYKEAMNFSDIEDVKVVKPRYDVACPSLAQEIKDLIQNREAVWDRYSDILE